MHLAHIFGRHPRRIVLLLTLLALLVLVAPASAAAPGQAAGALLTFEEKLAVVAFLAFIGERLVEALVTPIFDRYQWTHFWLTYIAWAVCSALVALSQVNLLEGQIPNATVGWVVTALLAGGGSNFIHEIFDTLVSLGSKLKRMPAEVAAQRMRPA